MNMGIENLIIQLIGLPDELIMTIFNKLNNIQLLYTLMGINTELDRILSDSVFTRYLVLLRNLSNNRIRPLSNTILDRFCLQILPQIHYKINFLTVEISAVERIFLAADYPNLYGLGLYNVDEESAKRLFNDRSPLFEVFNKKIQLLFITIVNKKNNRLEDNSVTSVFTSILNACNNLRYLNCHPFAEPHLPRLSFDDKTPVFFSSTLLELHINVAKFNDCLYLLNGHLNNLHTFYVKINYFGFPSEKIEDKKSLLNMKCFSLMCKSEIFCYNTSIVSLLQCMKNLENLSLYIYVGQRTFLDGNCLQNDIIKHLPRLNKFIFNIRCFIYNYDQDNLLSNEYIQDTFTDLGDIQVISCVDDFPNERSGQCHFYSYPYTLTYYEDITNNFPGGLFKCVREVSLFDERPFEHGFFIRITNAFPLLKTLSVMNQTPQKQKLNNNNEHLSIIEYRHLTDLCFTDSHDDYVDQFLVDTKTCLPKNVMLSIEYKSLKRVTNNFTRDATRVNCCKINYVHIYNRFQISKCLTNYFPNAKVLK